MQMTAGKTASTNNKQQTDSMSQHKTGDKVSVTVEGEITAIGGIEGTDVQNLTLKLKDGSSINVQSDEAKAAAAHPLADTPPAAHEEEGDDEGEGEEGDEAAKAAKKAAKAAKKANK